MSEIQLTTSIVLLSLLLALRIHVELKKMHGGVKG
jgi:hypothetical protein